MSIHQTPFRSSGLRRCPLRFVTIAFCLVIINGYDLLGALQEYWMVYWYSLVSSVVASALFWIMGPRWNKLVGLELGTFFVLGMAMWFA